MYLVDVYVEREYVLRRWICVCRGRERDRQTKMELTMIDKSLTKLRRPSPHTYAHAGPLGGLRGG